MIYSDTDSLVYEIQNDDIYEWTKQHKSLFDLSDSERPDLKDNTNKKVIGVMKDEMSSLLIKEFIALNPKVYSISHQHKDKNGMLHENYNKKTLTGLQGGCKE